MMMKDSTVEWFARPPPIDLHGLDFGDVGRFERVERVDGRLERRYCLGQVALALLLDALRSRRMLVGRHLVTGDHLHTPALLSNS